MKKNQKKLSSLLVGAAFAGLMAGTGTLAACSGDAAKASQNGCNGPNGCGAQGTKKEANGCNGHGTKKEANGCNGPNGCNAAKKAAEKKS